MKNIIKPPFLQKIDHWLKLNHPNLWVMNLHFLFSYSLLFLVLEWFISLVFPISLSNIPLMGVVFIYLLIPVFLCAIIWIVKLQFYNIHQNYVKQAVFVEIAKYFGYILGLSFLAIHLFFLPWLLSVKVTELYTEHEIKLIDKSNFYLAGHISQVKIDTIRDEITFASDYFNYGIIDSNFLSTSTDSVKNGDYSKSYEMVTYKLSYVKSNIDSILKINKRFFPYTHNLNVTSDMVLENLLHKGENRYDVFCSTMGTYYPHTKCIYNTLFEYKECTFYPENLRNGYLEIIGWFMMVIAYLLAISSVMSWQQLLRLGIVLALLPIVLGIIGFSISVFGGDDDFGYIFFFLLYLGLICLVFKNIGEKEFSPAINVILAIIALSFPLIPLYMHAWVREVTYGGVDFDYIRVLIFVFGIIGVLIFTPLLKKHYALPKSK